MSYSSRLSALPLRKSRTPGLSEIEVLLDAIPKAALLIDARSHRITLANARATELTSYTRDEFLEIELDTLFLVPESEGGEKNIFQVIEDQVRKISLILLRRGGIQLHIEIESTLLDGQGNWILLTFEPITYREQVEANRERNSQLWDALDSLVQACQVEDLNESLCIALQAGSTLTGGTCLAVYQANGEIPILQRLATFGKADFLPELIPPEDFAFLQKPQLWTSRTRTLSSLHRFARVANLDYLASAPIGQTNATIGLIVVASDQSTPPENALSILRVLSRGITIIIEGHALLGNLRRRISDQLSRLTLNSAIIDSAQDNVIILAPDLTILTLNPSAEHTLGYNNQEVHGQAIENILISSDALEQTFTAAQKNLHTCSLSEVRLFRRNGVSFLANLRVLPIARDEELNGIVIIFNDLSEQERYRVQSQLLEQRATLGEVTASFAHEVRNPINNISTGLQLLALNLPEDDPNQDQIVRLQQDCDRLAELVKSSLSFVRPMEYHLESVDLGGLLKYILERRQSRLVRYNIQQHLQIENNVPPVEGDVRALEQVFNNLIDNATQAMEERGGFLSVKIRLSPGSEERDHVEVSISDTGTGIPQDIRDRIFEPFFTTKQNGTGLGLAIVKRIITAHKGSIDVTSVTGGTIFRVRLPPA